MITAAISTYKSHGLEFRPLEVIFGGNCGEYSGLYYFGESKIRLCETDGDFVWKLMLHELAHAWDDHNVTDEVRERYGAIYGETWNSSDTDHHNRSVEKFAEMIVGYL